MEFLEVEQVHKYFGGIPALAGVSLKVEKGKIHGVIGPNGAGKTTTIRMLSALIAPTSGEARVAGYQVGEEDYQIRKSVGILTETPGM